MTALAPLHQFMSAMDRQIERRKEIMRAAETRPLTYGELALLSNEQRNELSGRNGCIKDKYKLICGCPECQERFADISRRAFRRPQEGDPQDTKNYLDEMGSDIAEARSKGWNL
jgi:hypothetical protein